MAPSRPQRTVEDLRSETASTIFNSKEKSSLATASANGGVSKHKKATAAVPTTSSKKLAAATVAATAAAAAAAAAAAEAAAEATAAAPTPTTTIAATEIDPTAPRIDWTSVSVAVLHTYRTAYRLPTQSSHTHPHADLIYKSSRTALRSPSAVLVRQRLRDLKHQRRKAARRQPAHHSLNHNQNHNNNNKSRSRGTEKDRDTDSSSNSDNLLKPYAAAAAHAEGHTPSDNHSASPAASTPGAAAAAAADQSPVRPAIIPEYIGKQPPASLATAVRKHFNAQQLNEATVVSRFTYIAKHAHSDHTANRTDGCAGDGDGWWMGTHGREIRRGHGGDVGFRLRFTP